MSYQIAQDFEYIGNDFWRWWAWIDAEDAELDNVKEVVWFLHPSFKRARRVTEDRSTCFRLDTAGWGTFLLRAEVALKNDEKRLLTHNVRLEYPDNTGARLRGKTEATAEPARAKTVFLSYSGQDARMASKLREGLKQAGVEVLDQSRINSGEPWSEAVQRMIAQSDAVIGLVGSDEISPFVIDELGAAVASAKPSVVLLPADNSGVELPSSVTKLRFDPVSPNVLSIAQFLKRQSAAD
jgi:hypothetical protein